MSVNTTLTHTHQPNSKKIQPKKVITTFRSLYFLILFVFEKQKFLGGRWGGVRVPTGGVNFFIFF